ncbi:MAG TPA: glutaredoxin 3 [Gammaproteobacteria bacterium]|nr:glutaredoxin 3 [Gammaproteobacteria bacterium]
MASVEIYFAPWCPYCRRAKQLLDDKQINYTLIDVDTDPNERVVMQQRGGGKTIPQIFIDNVSIGGCDELYALDANGKLDQLLSK